MKRAFTLIEFIVVIVIILILAAILFPVFMRPDEGGGRRRSICQSNLKQIGLGFAQYGQDYNEKFPRAQVNASTGWADVLQPYIKSRQIFQCPTAPNASPSLTDYFYNRRASDVVVDKFESSSQTILTGDGNDNAPMWASLSQLPPSWIKIESSPARRHLDGANYGFADGHVKYLTPSKVKSTFSQKDFLPTFAIR
ncbi:hypothetical protein IAD21_03416 [Abditibacteriota bacterium]|nr:hypothetical protein IAD21_03416 [Abditibacteriota bacterium]